MAHITAEDLLVVFTASAKTSAGRLGQSRFDRVTLEGEFDLIDIDKRLSDFEPKVDIFDAIVALHPDIFATAENLWEVEINATLDFHKLALALISPDLATSGLKFENEDDAGIIFLINAGRNCYPLEDNTVAIRHDRESAEKVAEILRERWDGSTLSPDRLYEWVEVIPKKIGTVF